MKDENALIKLQTKSWFNDHPWMDVFGFVCGSVSRETLLSLRLRERQGITRGYVGDTILHLLFLFEVETSLVKEWLEVDNGANLVNPSNLLQLTRACDPNTSIL